MASQLAQNGERYKGNFMPTPWVRSNQSMPVSTQLLRFGCNNGWLTNHNTRASKDEGIVSTIRNNGIICTQVR